MRYDYIIPMGEECYTCGSIDSKFNDVSVRKCAFPFDYVGHVFIEQITQKCKVLLSDNKSDPDNLEIKLFGENYFFSDTSYGFHYWHDTTHTDVASFTPQEKEEFVEKYKRRYERLAAAIRSKRPVLCISVNHYDNIFRGMYKAESLMALYELLYSYNPLLKFLAINYGPDSYTYGNLKHVALPCDRGMPFAESKAAFTSSLNAYMRGYEA